MLFAGDSVESCDCARCRPERHEVPYWSLYSKPRMLLYSITVSKYFDLAIAGVIGLNVITMALEFYLMPKVSFPLIC